MRPARQLREQAGVSLSQMARLIDVDKSALMRFELSGARIRPDAVLAYLRELGARLNRDIAAGDLMEEGDATDCLETGSTPAKQGIPHAVRLLLPGVKTHSRRYNTAYHRVRRAVKSGRTARQDVYEALLASGYSATDIMLAGLQVSPPTSTPE